MKTMLLDCSNLYHKAFYKKDFDYVEEFYTTIDRLKRCFSPDNVIFSLDSDYETWRHELYKPYKANRPMKTPEFIAFKEYLQEKIKREEIYMFLEGYESDDLIGSYVTKYKHEEDILIVTQDLDHSQLLDTNVMQLKFIGDFELEQVDINYTKLRFGIPPKYMADLKALAGDKSDNIKGLWRVGEQKAAKLINEFGGIKEMIPLFKDIKEEDRTPLQQQVLDNEEALFLYLKLTTIVTDLDV